MYPEVRLVGFATERRVRVKLAIGMLLPVLPVETTGETQKPLYTCE